MTASRVGMESSNSTSLKHSPRHFESSSTAEARIQVFFFIKSVERLLFDHRVEGKSYLQRVASGAQIMRLLAIESLFAIVRSGGKLCKMHFP